MTSSRTASHGPSFEEDHVLVHLGSLMNQARELIEGSQTRDQLRPSQFRVIGWVPYDGAVTVTELAERVGMSKQAIGQFVTELVRSGHLVTEEDPHDRRLRVVHRTERGNEVTMELAKMLERLELCWSEAIGTRRYQQFRAALEDIAALRR
jgi:DNA-binding MarR family transcriptional regulator